LVVDFLKNLRKCNYLDTAREMIWIDLKLLTKIFWKPTRETTINKTHRTICKMM